MTRAMMLPTRRRFLATAGACLTLPAAARAAEYREITWDDLIPPGVPYAEIIGEGELDEVKDTWNPIYDVNAIKLNQSIDGAAIRMPGYIVPLEIGAEGVTDFILVPYVGACIHVPPPPANQLVYVTSPTPWPVDDIWQAVWISGRIQAELRNTEIAETGYRIQADHIETYEW